MNVRKLNNFEFMEKKLQKNEASQNSQFERLNSSYEKGWFYLTMILGATLLVFSLTAIWIQNEHKKTEKNYQRELQIKEIQNTLASAVIASGSNEYELSRQTANDFFGLIEKEVALENESIFNPDQRETIKEILRKRAEINQSLADQKPQAHDKLENILEKYQKAVKGFQPLKEK